jgi:2,3-bisphosphoglycerate-dependent phosphoglycerate mutase
MLYLIRHAHAPYEPDETRGLSVEGRAAADRVAELLAGAGIGSIHSSPYTRAIETVQPLADRLGLPVAIHEDLRERRLAHGPVDDFRAAVAATWRDFALVHPGGESSAAAQARVAAAIHGIAAASDAPVAIASHGNALALFLRTLDASVDYAFWSRMTVPDVFAVDRSARPWAFQRLWTGQPT